MGVGTYAWKFYNFYPYQTQFINQVIPTCYKLYKYKQQPICKNKNPTTQPTYRAGKETSHTLSTIVQQQSSQVIWLFSSFIYWLVGIFTNLYKYTQYLVLYYTKPVSSFLFQKTYQHAFPFSIYGRLISALYGCIASFYK